MIAEADADWRSMLDRALDLGVTYIDIMGFFSAHAAAFNRGVSTEHIIGHIGEQISYLAAHGGRVSFDPMDGPRQTDCWRLGIPLMEMKDTTGFTISCSAGQKRRRESEGCSDPSSCCLPGKRELCLLT